MSSEAGLWIVSLVAFLALALLVLAMLKPLFGKFRIRVERRKPHRRAKRSTAKSKKRKHVWIKLA